jgi:putative component of membrane protein insertase Oxa1/YidC/SpoIIIJ protein YidD
MRFKILLLTTISLNAVPGYFEPWGNDADLIHREVSAPPAPSHLSLLGRAMQSVIHFHQTVISPADGPRSHFKPSSSNYMLQAIHKYGFFQGYIMGCDRLLRENSDPWVYRTAEIDGKIWKTDPP